MSDIIDLLLTEEQKMFRSTIRDFCQKEIMPYINQWDEQCEYPAELLPKLAHSGILGITAPEEYGGAGGGITELVILMEETTKCGTIVVPMSSIGIVMEILTHFGTREQQLKYIPDMVSGNKVAAYAQTEPNAGTDVPSMQTYVAEHGDDLIINGQKHFITYGELADFILLIAKSDKNGGSECIGVYIVDKGTPGMKITRRDRKMGWHIMPTNEIYFENCIIPKENVVIPPGGFKQLMNLFNSERCGNAASCVGAAEGAFQLAFDYIQSRTVSGKKVSEYQGNQWILAEMLTAITSARLLLYNAAIKGDRGERIAKDAAMAKYTANEMVQYVTNAAMQFFGGYGYMSEVGIERYYRDTRGLAFGGGTPTVLRNRVAYEILKGRVWD